MEGPIYWPSFFFLLFAGIACLFSLAVVFTGNVVRMAFYLVIALAATAGLFFLAGADFVGAMQIMIYVGGTLVLLIFGVMLTAQSPFVTMKTSSGEWVLAALVGGALLALLLPTAFSIGKWRAMTRAEAEGLQAPATATPLGMAMLGVRVDRLGPDSSGSDSSGSAGAATANPRQEGYLLPFEIISVHLLVVLVGAAYLARARRRRRASIAEQT